MEGAALRKKAQLDVETFAAWHTAVFALERYNNKLKPLSKYLGDGERKEPKPAALQRAEAIAFFHRMKERGFDVSITRH